MTGVRAWAFTICGVAVLGGIFGMLLPENGVAKIVRFGLKLVFLLCLISPLKSLAGMPPMEGWQQQSEQREQVGEQLQQALEEQTALLAKQQLEAEIGQLLLSEKILYEKIELTIHQKGQEGISISELKITLAGEEKARQEVISRIVKEKTGIEPILQFWG